MNKVHYDPYCDGEAPDIAECGTRVGCEEFLHAANWSLVTCKRCLNKRDKIEAVYEKSEEDIVNQMEDMVKFQNGVEGDE